MDDRAAEVVLHGEAVRAAAVTSGVRVARLRRVVVVERRTIEVEVAHEEFRVEVEDRDPADAPADPGPEVVSTVLHEERIEVVKRIVPVERVSLTAIRTPRIERVDLEVRHEEAEVDGTRPTP